MAEGEVPNPDPIKVGLSHNVGPVHVEGGGGSTGISRKIGPLPLWAWFLCGVGVLGVVYLAKRRMGASGTSAADLGNAPTNSGAGPGGDQSGNSDLQAMQANFAKMMTDQQTAQSAKDQAMNDAFSAQSKSQSDALSALGQSLMSAEQQDMQGMNAALAAQQQSQQSGLAQLMAQFQSQFQSFGQSMAAATAAASRSMPTITLPSGRQVQIPQAPQGPGPGPQSASWQNPSGSSGSWGGMNDQAIQAAFLQAAGGNQQKAQADWQAQHAAEVAAHGY